MNAVLKWDATKNDEKTTEEEKKNAQNTKSIDNKDH